MRKLIRLSIIVVLTILLILTLLVINKLHAETKIYLLHSYSLSNTSSTLQNNGMFEALAKDMPGNFYKSFYMNNDIKTTSEASLEEISRYAYKNIEDYKPNYIVVFGDVAFKYVIIPYFLKPKSKIPIIFSGLLQNYDTYADEYNLRLISIGGIQENYDFTLFKKFILSSFISLWKINVLYDPSPTSRLILNNVLSEFKNKNISNVALTEIHDYNSLVKKVIELNKQDRSIIFSCVSKLNNNEKAIISTPEILRTIRTYNKDSLEISSFTYCNNPNIGFAIGLGPNYYEIGSMIGLMLTKKDFTISSSQTILSVNTQRMSELGLSEVYKKSKTLFENIYAYYE